MFSHEKLLVYQKSIQFVSQPLIEALPRSAVRDQFDRASTSIPLNLAEGNVKFSVADRARFMQIAQGSAVACAACLDVIVARQMKTLDDVIEGKAVLVEIVKMSAVLLSRLGYRFDQESPRIKEAGANEDEEKDEE